MILEDMKLSEINQTQKDKFLLYEVPRGVKSIETESRTVGDFPFQCRGYGFDPCLGS